MRNRVFSRDVYVQLTDKEREYFTRPGQLGPVDQKMTDIKSKAKELLVRACSNCADCLSCNCNSAEEDAREKPASIWKRLGC